MLPHTHNPTFRRPSTSPYLSRRSPSPPRAWVEPLSPPHKLEPIEPNFNYPALTHPVYAAAPNNAVASTPVSRTQGASRSRHHRTPSTIDTLAEAALAVSPGLFGPSRKRSESYAQQPTRNYGQVSRASYGASEPPHKRARSELLPSPYVGQYASRPATSYDSHASQAGYDRRVEEAALLLNFRTGGWPVHSNAMSPPQLPASAVTRPHANSFPQSAPYARTAESNMSGLLPPFAPQQGGQNGVSSAAAGAGPPIAAQPLSTSPDLRDDPDETDDWSTSAVAGVSGRAGAKQAQMPPSATHSRAPSHDVSQSDVSEPSKSRRGWPKGKPRGSGNRKTIAEKVATKRAAARKKAAHSSKSSRGSKDRLTSEPISVPDGPPRRNSMTADPPSRVVEREMPLARGCSVPRDISMVITAAKPPRRQAKVTSDTVCAGCQTSRESSAAVSETDEWISCNGCRKWFHVDCAGFKKLHEVKDVDKFFCIACEPTHGKTTYVRKSSRAHTAVDYAELQKGVLKTSEESVEHHYIQSIKDGTFQFDPECFPRMRPEMVTRDFFERSSTFTEPICIPAAWNPRPWAGKPRHPGAAADGVDNDAESGEPVDIDAPTYDTRDFEYDTVPNDNQDRLDMVMPEGLSVRQVCNLVGPDTPLDVIDVKTQNSGGRWNLGRWADYYEEPGTDKPIRNVISLEVSQSKLGRVLRRPKLVRDIDLQDSVWPQEEREKGKWPKVQYYCLMSVADSYTDFHIDFGGSSVYYHILKGKKTFFFIPPKAKNLKAYEEWNESPQQNFTFLPSITKECYRVDLSEGDTMLIPSGWIHAVWTPETSLVIGGNFLTRMSYKNQFKVVEIEKANRTPMKFRYPFFQKIMWYTAIQYLTEDPLPVEVKEAFNNGKRFERPVPIWQDFDGEIAAHDPRAGARNARYYPQSELEGLPDLVNYIWRTVMMVMGRIEGISEDQKKRVNASIPKGFGEPLKISQDLALWAAWKRGNEDPPAWAHPDFALDTIKEEGPPKKLSARALKDLERKEAIAAWRVAPDRQSERVMSKNAAPAATPPVATNGIDAQSPAPPAVEAHIPSEIHQQPQASIERTPSAVSPAAFIIHGVPGQHFSTPKTSVLGPKRVACDTCRKRRIRCKHKDQVLQATPENLGRLAGISQFDAFQAHLAPELQDNITVANGNTGPYSIDGANGFIASGSDGHDGQGAPQPGTNAYINANIPMAMNGVPIFGEAQKRGRTKACFECRRSKRRCVHDENGNVDPIKAAETPIPRGSNPSKKRDSEGEGSPEGLKKVRQNSSKPSSPLEAGGTRGMLVPQKPAPAPSKAPAVRPPSRQHQAPPQILVEHSPDVEQPEIDPSLFSYPEPAQNGHFAESGNPYYAPQEAHGQHYEYPSLEQIASEVLDMNGMDGRADEDWIDRQLNALPYERTNGPRPESRRGPIPFMTDGASKSDGSVDSAVSLPYANGTSQDAHRSVDDRLREALTGDTIMGGVHPSIEIRPPTAPNGAHANGDGIAAASPEATYTLPLYQPPAPVSQSPELVKRQPMVNGTAKRKSEEPGDAAAAAAKKAKLAQQAMRELSPQQETEDERLARLLQQDEHGLRLRSPA